MCGLINTFWVSCGAFSRKQLVASFRIVRAGVRRLAASRGFHLADVNYEDAKQEIGVRVCRYARGPMK